MSNFIKGDFAKDEKGHVGKVTGSMGAGVYVFDALSGQNGFIDDPQPATQEEYNAQIEQRLHPKSAPAKEATLTPTLRVAPMKQTKRYLCLDCGETFNGRVCPLCGSDEKIENVDMSRHPGGQ